MKSVLCQSVNLIVVLKLYKCEVDLGKGSTPFPSPPPFGEREGELEIDWERFL